MFTSSTISCKSPDQGKISKLYALGFKAAISFIILFTLFLSNSAGAQTIRQSNLSCDISNRNPCTSKDLDVVSVFIDAPTCVTCTGGTATFPLKMTIHNGTKSERTSFALYGTLSDGAKITFNGVDYEDNIFICVGPITVKSDQTLEGESAPGNQTFLVGSITFNCGQELSLTNNFLAWTDASGLTVPRCEEYAQATKCSDIAPKCGTRPSITIEGPLPAPAFTQVDPTCAVNTGSVTVTSPTIGWTYKLKRTGFADWSITPTAQSPTVVFSPLAAGQAFTLTVTNLTPCESAPASGTIGAAKSTPNAPSICITEPSLCGSATGSVSVNSPTIGWTYKLKRTGVADWSITPTAQSPTVVFSPLAAGVPFTVTVTNTDGCESQPTSCSSSSCATITKAAVPNNEVLNAQTKAFDIDARIKGKTKVMAAPNPFTDKVRFTLQSDVSGQGALEIYNVMGQKIHTVYEGYIEAGKQLVKEYNVPVSRRANLIYVFRVGDQKTTGKLLNW